jgi:hypothetical protein
MVRPPLISPRVTTSSPPLQAAAGHIELRKRNEAFAKKIGKVNKLKVVDPLEGKVVPMDKRVLYFLLALLCGGGTSTLLPFSRDVHADADEGRVGLLQVVGPLTNLIFGTVALKK